MDSSSEAIPFRRYAAVHLHSKHSLRGGWQREVSAVIEAQGSFIIA